MASHEDFQPSTHIKVCSDHFRSQVIWPENRSPASYINTTSIHRKQLHREQLQTNQADGYRPNVSAHSQYVASWTINIKSELLNNKNHHQKERNWPYL